MSKPRVKPGKGGGYPEEIRAEARRLHLAGESYRAIGEALGISPNTACGWCNEQYNQNRKAWKSRDYAAKMKSDPAFKLQARIHSLKMRARERGHEALDSSVEEIQAAYINQGHRCAICSKHELDITGGLVIDHCHATGRFRGLLCTKCNTSLFIVEKYGLKVQDYLNK